MLWSLLAKSDGKVKGCALLGIIGAGARQRRGFPKVCPENYLADCIQASVSSSLHLSGEAPWEWRSMPHFKALRELMSTLKLFRLCYPEH